MTIIDRTTAASFFEQAFGAISAFAHERRARRARHIALATLMEMDAARLDDLGLNAQDVVDALNTPQTEMLEERRTQRALGWSHTAPTTA